MKYKVITKTTETNKKIFEVLRQAVKDIQSVGVYPYPGVVEEAMRSRNLPVEISVDEASEELTLIVRKATPAPDRRGS